MPEFQEVSLPSGHTLYFRPDNHSYWTEVVPKNGGTLSGKGRITGVSTVSKSLDTNPDPLITWGAKLEAQGICELLSGWSDDYVSDILNAGGDALHGSLVAAGLDWRSVRNRRATEGTAIHEDVFAELGRGEVPSLADVEDEIRGYGQAAFAMWRDLQPEPIAVEQVVYLDEYGVAGRFDLLAKVDGETVLYDAKTAKRAYLSHHVQLAGYALGCTRSGFATPDRTCVVLLRADGSYELVEGVATTEDWDAAYEAYTATKRIGKAEREAQKVAA